MIQFKCPKCEKVLKVGDDKAGITAACPGCQAKIKVPAPKAAPTPVRKKKPAEDVEEVVPEDDEEEEAPRKKPARKSRDVEIDEEEEDDEDDRPRRKKGKKGAKEPSGKNVVSGIVYILLGLAIAAVGIVAPMTMDLQVDKMIPMIFGPVAGLLIAGLGIFYIVRS